MHFCKHFYYVSLFSYHIGFVENFLKLRTMFIHITDILSIPKPGLNIKISYCQYGNSCL